MLLYIKHIERWVGFGRECYMRCFTECYMRMKVSISRVHTQCHCGSNGSLVIIDEMMELCKEKNVDFVILKYKWKKHLTEINGKI